MSADLSEDQIDGPHQALGRSVRSPGMHKDRFHDSTTSLQWGAATKRIPLARDLLIYYSSVPGGQAFYSRLNRTTFQVIDKLSTA